MRQSSARHETFQYERNEPFRIKLAIAKDEDFFFIHHSHWHEELEIAYIMYGSNLHYIDGECIQAEPGRLIVTNCESIHRIETDYGNATPETCIGVVLLIHKQFLKENFPEYDHLMFTNEKRQTCQEIRNIMMECYDYALKEDHQPFEHLRMRGLLLQLLYYMCQEGTVNRDSVLDQARQQKEHRIKEILDYVEEHYSEPITQKDVAQHFFFSPQYFSRYFRQNEGITFTEHLTRYRLLQASRDLLHTDKMINEIAWDNGFSDSSQFINAFKKVYQITPLQYRKSQNKI